MPSYRIENAPSGKAKCKATTCDHAKIPKNELRLGTWVEIGGHGSYQWRHWGCVTARVIANMNTVVRNGDTLNMDMCDGYDDLKSDEDRKKIIESLERGYVDDADWLGPSDGNRPIVAESAKKAKKKRKNDKEEDAEEVEAADSPMPKRARASKLKEEKQRKKPIGKKAASPSEVLVEDDQEQHGEEEHDINEQTEDKNKEDDKLLAKKRKKVAKEIESSPEQLLKKRTEGSKNAAKKEKVSKGGASRASTRTRTKVSYYIPPVEDAEESGFVSEDDEFKDSKAVGHSDEGKKGTNKTGGTKKATKRKVTDENGVEPKKKSRPKKSQ